MEVVYQVGIGGTLALLVLKEVFGYVKSVKLNGNGNGNGRSTTSGDKPPEFWQMEFRRANTESLNATIVPILNNQTDILKEMAKSQHEMVTTNEHIAVMLDARRHPRD